MTTAVFVHGTGVRGERYRASFAEARGRLLELDGVTDVRPCLWGDDLGARLDAGASIPDYPADGDDAGDESDWDDVARWAVLEIDPLHELRVLGVRAPEVLDLPADHPAAPVRGDVVAAATDASVRAAVADAGLDAAWLAAVGDVLDSDAFARALHGADVGAVPERRAVARALVAQAELRAGPDGGSPTTPEQRDALVATLVRALDADKAGVTDEIITRLATVVVGGVALTMAPTATWLAARRRGAVADATAPMAGDIVLYQARGDRIRAYVGSVVQDVDDEVVLVAHSLGGIACVDLLATQPPDNVTGLVTVGSQAPFLYEIGALWSLEPSEPLPAGFPRWLNVYDRKDLLSYVAAPVFGATHDVVDVHVDNRSSFPRSHSRYFTNRRFYDALGSWLP